MSGALCRRGRGQSADIVILNHLSGCACRTVFVQGRVGLGGVSVQDLVTCELVHGGPLPSLSGQ